MPSDRSRPPSRAWRRDGSARDRQQAAQPRWRRDKEAPAAPVVTLSRRKKLAIVGAATALLVGVLIWVVWWLFPPKPAALVLVGAGYETNLAVPHNAEGWKGLKDLEGGCGSTGPDSSRPAPR